MSTDFQISPRHSALSAENAIIQLVSIWIAKHGVGDSFTRHVEPRLERVTFELTPLNGNECGRLLELKPLQLWKFPKVSLAKVSTFKVISGANDGGHATLVTAPIKVNRWHLIVGGRRLIGVW